MAAPIADELAALAKRHGVSRDSIINGAYSPEVRGTSGTFIRKVLAGSRRPNRAMLRALADVVGEPPEVFSAYQLLTARELLDEDPRTGVGLEQALANLELVRGPLGLESGPGEDAETLRLVAGDDVDEVVERPSRKQR